MFIGVEILLVIILVLINGVLAMSELAVVSARRSRLEQRASEGKSGARVAMELADEPTRFLSTVQIGITMVGILAGAFGGATLAEKVSNWLADAPVVGAYSDLLGVLVVVLIITYLSLVVGELVPKRLAMRNPEGIAVIMAIPMRVLATIARPAVALLAASVEGILRLFGARHNDEPEVTEADIQYLISEGTRTGVVEPHEQALVEAVFELGDRRVDELMTPRQWIVGIDISDSTEAIVQQIRASRYTHYPVYDGSLDHVLGIASIKSLWDQFADGQPLDPRAVVVPPLFVPEQTRVHNVMERFRETGNHVALVVDEFGAFTGLITLNDIVEALVGDIHAGPHSGEPQVVEREDGSWLIDGAMPVGELHDLLAIDAFPGEEENHYKTLGGYLMMTLGRVPEPADTVEWNGLRFEVVDMDGNRVDAVMVARLNDTDEPVETFG